MKCLQKEREKGKGAWAEKPKSDGIYRRLKTEETSRARTPRQLILQKGGNGPPAPNVNPETRLQGKRNSKRKKRKKRPKHGGR